MGSCFGICFPKHENNSNFNLFTNSSNDLSCVDNAYINRGINRRFLRLLFRKETKEKKPVLQLVDELLNNQKNQYSRLEEPSSSCAGVSTNSDIQLQCLDVRALLSNTNNSSPTDSLDLEWEHETVPFYMVCNQSENSCSNLSDDSSCPSGSSIPPSTQVNCQVSNSSRVSSENSLEWDSLYPTSPPMSEVDTDTKLLIGEIERLTQQTLLETGQDFRS